MNSQIENYPDISFIGDKSLEDFMEDARGWYVERWKELTGEDIKLQDTDEEKILLDSVSYIFYQVAQYLDNTGKQNLLKYSVGDFLDNIGARCGTVRTPARPATVTVRFTLTEEQGEDYAIPAGTQVASADSDDIYFATDRDAIIAAGETFADISCTCLTAGEDGNGYAIGSINELVDTLPYIDTVSNVTASDGGTDIEDDDSYAERIYLAPSVYSTAGTEDAYMYHAKSASSLVDDVIVYSPSACNVNVIITAKTGLPSQELIGIVSDYLNDKSRKVLTDNVTVLAPETVSFNIDVEYYISQDDQKNAEMIQAQVEAAVDKYVEWQTKKIGRNIIPSKLIQYIMEAGANRVSVNYPADTVVPSNKIAVLNDRTVTYGGLEDEW